MRHGDGKLPREYDAFYAELGLRIRQARKRQNKTQDELAAAVGLTRTSVTNAERGRQKLLVHSLARIAKELRIDVQELIPVVESNLRSFDRLASDEQELLSGAVPEILEEGS